MTEDQSDRASQNTGRSRITIPVSKATAKPWPGRLLMAVAAFLLVAVGVVSIGMKLIGSDDEPSATEGAGPTGFYVPGALPDGWAVTSVGNSYVSADGLGPDGRPNVSSPPRADGPFLACPCSVTEFDRGGVGRYTTVETVGGPDELKIKGADRVALDNSGDGGAAGRIGWYEEIADVRSMEWLTATGSRAIASTSLDRSELEGLADTWTTDDLPQLEGYRNVNSWSVDRPIVMAQASRWTFHNADLDTYVSIDIRPNTRKAEILLVPTITLPGNGLPAATVPGESEIIGSWPGGAELRAFSHTGDQIPLTDSAILDPAVEEILGSFQPVDAATWADHLKFSHREFQGSSGDFDVLLTGRISDWSTLTEQPKPTAKVTTTDLDDPSHGLTIETNLDQVLVAAGEPFTIELTMTNRTGATLDVSGCAFGTVTWSTVDDNGLVTQAGGVDVDCDPRPQPWSNGEQRKKTFDFTASDDEGPVAAVIQYGDMARRGITVVVPGRIGL